MGVGELIFDGCNSLLRWQRRRVFVGMLHCFDHIVAFSFVLRCDVLFAVAINNQLLSIGGALARVLVNSPHHGVVNASIERHRAC